MHILFLKNDESAGAFVRRTTTQYNVHEPGFASRPQFVTKIRSTFSSRLHPTHILSLRPTLWVSSQLCQPTWVRWQGIASLRMNEWWRYLQEYNRNFENVAAARPRVWRKEVLFPHSSIQLISFRCVQLYERVRDFVSQLEWYGNAQGFAFLRMNEWWRYLQEFRTIEVQYKRNVGFSGLL